MSNFDEVFERIKQATNTRTQVGLAAVLDIKQSSISDAKRRNSIPAEWYMKLLDRFSLNPKWLKNGTGPKYLQTNGEYLPAEAEPMSVAAESAAIYGSADAKSELVNVYAMHSWPEKDSGETPKVSGKLSIPLSFAGDGIRVFQLDASSMEPAIRKGAFIALDVTQKQVVSGELYGVTLPCEGLAIKRIFLDSSGSNYVLRSENPNHPELTLSMETLAESIVGRVSWVLHRY